MRCPNCKIDVVSSSDKCPLCHGVLEGERQETYYPKATKVKRLKYVSFSRIGLIFAIVLSLVSIIIDKALGGNSWAAVAVFAILAIYIFIRHTCFSRNSIFTRTVYLISIVTLELIIVTASFPENAYVCLGLVAPIIVTVASILMLATLFSESNKQGVLQLMVFGLITIILLLDGILWLKFDIGQMIALIVCTVVTNAVQLFAAIRFRRVLRIHLRKGFSPD